MIDAKSSAGVYSFNFCWVLLYKIVSFPSCRSEGCNSGCNSGCTENLAGLNNLTVYCYKTGMSSIYTLYINALKKERWPLSHTTDWWWWSPLFSSHTTDWWWWSPLFSSHTAEWWWWSPLLTPPIELTGPWRRTRGGGMRRGRGRGRRGSGGRSGGGRAGTLRYALNKPLLSRYAAVTQQLRSR